MIPIIEARTQKYLSREEAEIKGELKGEMGAKIEMIEAFLKIDVSWKTITQATQINQKLYQSMKALYANIVLAAIPEVTEEIVKELYIKTEYIIRRRAMVVNILDHRFQLSEEQQDAMLERLTIFNQREPLDGLVNSALIVEDMNLFEDELTDLLDSGSQQSDL